MKEEVLKFVKTVMVIGLKKNYVWKRKTSLMKWNGQISKYVTITG